MKNLSLFLITTLCLHFSAKAQFSVSAGEQAIIIDEARPLIKSLLTRFSCEYIKGGVSINTRWGNSSSATYKGSIRYNSPNCNNISADLEIKVVQDGSEISLSQVCIYMPTCFLGSPLDVYSWECKYSE